MLFSSTEYQDAYNAVKLFTKTPDYFTTYQGDAHFSAIFNLAYETVSSFDQTLERAENLHRHTAENMTRVADNLAKEGAGAYFNTLGELQSRATELDRLLGELHRLREQLCLIQKVIAPYTVGD